MDAVPEFDDFLLAHAPTIDQIAIYRANEKWLLRQIPGFKPVLFFDVTATMKDMVQLRV